jgi:hypothetical protein
MESRPPEINNLTKNQAISILWSKGILTFKLDAVQKELYECFHKATDKITVWSCSRRLGKSYALCCLAIEECIKRPGTIVKYIAPTQKHVKNIIRPIITEILKDCPPPLRPEFKVSECVYRFSNGSEIQMAGTDSGHAEGLRGGSSHLCIVDEAGFCNNLSYIIQSILIPTTTITRGKIILSSTPPISPDHDFEEYRKDAEFKGNYIKKTIYDGLGSRITLDIIKEIIDAMGGEDSSDFRREYMCEPSIDERHAVVPEFNLKLEAEVVKEWTRGAFADNYVAGDIGAKDLTVFLFGYYDFRNAKLIIEDELVLNGQEKSFTTDTLANGIKEKESKVFVNPLTKEFEKPFLRVCDNNLIVIGDLHKLHGLICVPTAKDDAEAALNNMRIMLKEKRIIINPRCKTLIFHLKNATWKKGGATFSRSPDAGHYDAVDALKYMVRNINLTRNPYPSDYDRDKDKAYSDQGAKKELTHVQTQIKSWFEPRYSLKIKRQGIFNK